MELLNYLYLKLTCGLECFLRDEDGAVDIVAIVVLIGIAVVLAVLFRSRIEGLLGTLFDGIDQNATNAVKQSVN